MPALHSDSEYFTMADDPGGFHMLMGTTLTPEAKRVFRRIAESVE